MTDWDRRLLGLAEYVAAWSKDPSTKVGAVITRPDHRIVSIGYNGLPIGVKDTEDRLAVREVKYRVMVHAEANALVTARGSVEGCLLFTWPFPPCAPCSALFIQAGILRICAPVPSAAIWERWSVDLELAAEMLDEAGVILDLENL
jgi:dCMP deaminase